MANGLTVLLDRGARALGWWTHQCASLGTLRRVFGLSEGRIHADISLDKPEGIINMRTLFSNTRFSRTEGDVWLPVLSASGICWSRRL